MALPFTRNRRLGWTHPTAWSCLLPHPRWRTPDATRSPARKRLFLGRNPWIDVRAVSTVRGFSDMRSGVQQLVGEPGRRRKGRGYGRRSGQGSGQGCDRTHHRRRFGAHRHRRSGRRRRRPEPDAARQGPTSSAPASAERGGVVGHQQAPRTVVPGTWSISASPNISADNGLFGSSCVSAAFCMAVGFAFDGGGFRQPMAEEWSGTSWSALAVPSPSVTQDINLVGVSCPSVAFCSAVGYNDEVGGSGHYQPVIEQWNGAAWSLAATPALPAGVDYRLFRVSCVSAVSCMAVGDSYNSGSTTFETIALLWNGATWSVTANPSPGLNGYFEDVRARARRGAPRWAGRSAGPPWWNGGTGPPGRCSPLPIRAPGPTPCSTPYPARARPSAPPPATPTAAPTRSWPKSTWTSTGLGRWWSCDRTRPRHRQRGCGAWSWHQAPCRV